MSADLPDLDLDVLECRRRKRYQRQRVVGVVEHAGFELPVIELAAWVVRTELLRRARGMLRVLDERGSVARVAHARCVETGLRRWYLDEAETGLIWLATRGLVEAVEPGRPWATVYRWTPNATEDRLRVTIMGVR